MKKIFFLSLAVFTLGFFSSCKKDDQSTTDSLIEEIATSSSKININPEMLPEQAKQTIEDEYFETYIETASLVESKGYEITMGNEDLLYFDIQGRELRGRAHRHGPHRPGPCGRGEPVSINDLPDDIIDYVTENYPDEDILRAKLKAGKYLVKITGHLILVFDTDGNFIEEAHVFRFCNHFVDRINIDNLPDVIVDYISDNYPGAEIKVAWKVRGKIIVGVITPEGRKILVFDLDGNFLFERG